jgi:hypothetical protein
LPDVSVNGAIVGGTHVIGNRDSLMAASTATLATRPQVPAILRPTSGLQGLYHVSLTDHPRVVLRPAFGVLH